MKRLVIKSNEKREHMKEWLSFILDTTLSGLGKEIPLDGSFEEFEYIKWMVDSDLKQLQVRDNVTTDLVSDSGETVLFIKRSGHILVSIYIK